MNRTLPNIGPGLAASVARSMADAHGELDDDYAGACDRPAADLTPLEFSDYLRAARPGCVASVTSSFMAGEATGTQLKYDAILFGTCGEKPARARGDSLRALLAESLAKLTRRQDVVDVGAGVTAREGR